MPSVAAERELNDTRVRDRPAPARLPLPNGLPPRSAAGHAYAVVPGGATAQARHHLALISVRTLCLSGLPIGVNGIASMTSTCSGTL